MERSEGGRKKNPNGLPLPNQNVIKINIILKNFKRYGKSTMKFN